MKLSLFIFYIKGENSIVIILGANALLTPDDVNDAYDLIQNAAVLLTQFETPLNTTLRALKLHRGHGKFLEFIIYLLFFFIILPIAGISIVNGAPAVVNADLEILKNCDIFCVNETEVYVELFSN